MVTQQLGDKSGFALALLEKASHLPNASLYDLYIKQLSYVTTQKN